MASITYFIVALFIRGEHGALQPAEAQETPNRETARRRAQAVVGSNYVDAVAFARTGDPSTGEFGEGESIRPVRRG